MALPTVGRGLRRAQPSRRTKYRHGRAALPAPRATEESSEKVRNKTEKRVNRSVETMNNRISPTCRASQPEMGTATAFATEKEEVLGEPWSRNALVVAHYLVNVRIDLRMKDKPHQFRRRSIRWSSSSNDMPKDGFASNSASRRRASAMPSSSSWGTDGSDPSARYKHVARSRSVLQSPGTADERAAFLRQDA